MREPDPKANAYTVEELLQKCDPPVRYEEISELGAAVEVQFRYWNCPVNSKRGCVPTVHARRVDTLFSSSQGVGFGFKRTEVNPKNPDERELLVGWLCW